MENSPQSLSSRLGKKTPYIYDLAWIAAFTETEGSFSITPAARKKALDENSLLERVVGGLVYQFEGKTSFYHQLFNRIFEVSGTRSEKKWLISGMEAARMVSLVHPFHRKRELSPDLQYRIGLLANLGYYPHPITEDFDPSLFSKHYLAAWFQTSLGVRAKIEHPDPEILQYIIDNFGGSKHPSERHSVVVLYKEALERSLAELSSYFRGSFLGINNQPLMGSSEFKVQSEPLPLLENAAAQIGVWERVIRIHLKDPSQNTADLDFREIPVEVERLFKLALELVGITTTKDNLTYVEAYQAIQVLKNLMYKYPSLITIQEVVATLKREKLIRSTRS
jgi:hypothetical protein